MTAATKLLGPLTDGEIDDCFERWSQFAITEDDWKVVRAFGELKRNREAAFDARAYLAECDDDTDTCFVGVTG